MKHNLFKFIEINKPSIQVVITLFISKYYIETNKLK